MGVKAYRFFVFFARIAKRAGVHYAPLRSCVCEECGFQGIPRGWPSGRVAMWNLSASWLPVWPRIHGGGRCRVVRMVVGDAA